MATSKVEWLHAYWVSPIPISLPIGPLDWVSTFGPIVATYKVGGSMKCHLCWEAYLDGGVFRGRPNQALRMADFSQHLYAVERTNHTHKSIATKR